MFDRRPSLNKMEASTVDQSLSPLKTQRGPSDTDYSPTISRYGRSHKPKIQDDYVSTDKKVSAYLKLSPGNQMQYFSTMKEPKKKHSPKKMSPEGGVRRGRPPKPKTPITDQNNSVDSLVSPIKLEPQDPLLPVNGCEWMVGDLAWGRVGGHPFWPCIIALDPMQKIFTKIVLRGRNTVVGQRWMHVQFFGDNGRRSWLNSSAIMTFSGRDAFLQLSETVLAGMRKKDPKQTSAFVIKPAVVQVWEKAVQEAEDLANATREERIAFFAANFPYVITEQLPKEEVTGPILEEDPLASPPPKKRGRKRKADTSSQEDLLKSKQIKLEKEDVKEDVNESAEPMETDVTVKVEKEVTQPMKTEVKEEVSEERHSLLSSTPRTIADRKKRQALLMQMARSNRMAAADAACDVTPASAPATPATPNHRPSFAESTPIEKKKPKKKYSKRVAPIVNNDFQNFCSRNFDKVSDEHPDLNEKEINKHLQNLWNNMDDTAKSRFRARKGVVTQEQEDSDSLEETSEELEEDNDADVQSSKSSNEAEPQSSVSSSPAAEASVKPVPAKRTLKKLFTGIKFEKVCQICEKAGDTVRCRGPCQGFYHPNCTTNPPPAPLDTPVPTPRKGRFGRTPRRKSIVENGTPAKEEKEENSVVETDTPVKIKEEIKTEEVAVEVVEPENKGSAKVRKGSKDGEEEEGFRCKECSQGRSQPCFICHSYVQEKTGEAKLYRCITSNCGKVYHEECLKAWPQTSWRGNDRGLLTSCPQHTCHTCASDNPAVIKARYNHDKLVRCIRCPTSYHHGNYCLPAGSEILTNSQIICPRHYKPPKKGLITHINAAWCFICASGGELICCDLCPTAFHADCLQLSDPPDTYVCEDCQTGRFPLYGEIVWVKLGRYRWWPAKILYPSQIPDNILNLPHVRGEFAVRFFGSHDHYWVNRGRVFLYQDGDTAGKTKYKKASVDHTFEKAVIEASEAQRKYLLDKASRDAETRPGMKPPHYVKLKTNKPVGSVRPLEMNLSNLTPCECDPTKDNPCAPDSDCLNRILMVECNPQVCPAGEKCCNQLFEKRQYPPLQPYQTLERGWGLKTLVPLKKGDFVIEYVGEMIDEEEYKRRLADMHERNDDNFYFLTIDKDRMLDAGPKGNVARFMNHSCQPNCETQKWTVNGDTRVGLFALYDIPANTELVFNYNLESTGNEKKPCMCGAPNCSGFIGVKAIKQEKEDKEKKPVKKKRVAKPSEVKCFMCCKEGDLLRCDGKKCTKVYHLSCLGKKQAPQGYWLCPWHQCNVCHKGRVRRCHLCVNSYCQEHAEGNIREDPDSKHLICTKHDQDQAVGIQDAKGSSLLMEVDGNSSDNSTTTSSLSSDPPVKEVTNNNVVKDVGTPRLRTRRSKSFADIVVNGSVEKVNTRRKRPSSVDEVLIQETTELKNKRSYKPLDEINTKSIAREIIDEVIDKFPVETKYSLKINENCEETKENILSLNKDFDIEEKKSPEELNDNGGNENTEENKTEIINASYEVENPNDTSETDTDKLSGKDLTSTKASENVDSLKYYKSCPLELSKEDESIAKNVEPKNNIDYHEIVESDEITNEDMLVENRTENEFAESKPFKDIPNGESQNPTNNVDNDMKHISVSESSEKENLVQNGIVDKNSEDESSLNQSEEEACKSEPMEVKTIGASPNSGRMIDTDENLDDFELSYSENSTDKLFKSVNNSESSIEMKVTNCGTTEEDTIARKLEELHGTSDMVNGVEQSSVA